MTNDTTSPSPEQRKSLIAGAVGNFVEWFDYGIYGFLAVTISTVFFPSDDPTAALLATFGIFALPVITRPLGGVFFARFGDTIGRKQTLSLVLILMSLSTAGIGFIPGYDTIGVAAPLLLVVARIIQGFSAGGEYAGGAALIAESSPAAKRGFLVSFMPASTGLGLLAGSMLAFLLTSTLSAEAMHDWGWRVAFILALPLGAIGLYIRLKLEETEAFRELVSTGDVAASPFKETITQHGSRVLQVAGIALAQTVCYYVVLVYTPTLMRTDLGLAQWQSLLTTSVAIAVYVITIVISGRLSDRVGRKPLLYLGGVLMLLTVFPTFLLMPVAPFFVVVVLQALTGGVALGIYTGPLVCAWVELFPTRVRYSGVAAGFSLAVIVSVSSPFVLTWLIATTGSDLMPAIYVAVSCVISLLTLAKTPETAPSKDTLNKFAMETH